MNTARSANVSITLGLVFLLTATVAGRAMGDGPATGPMATAASPEVFAESLRAAKPGDVLSTPFVDLAGMPQLPLTLTVPADAPQFLLSDKPEYFRTGDGISMQEDVQPGLVRLYLYHVPEPTGAKKTISAVIENLGDAPMNLAFLRYSSPKPSGDYHRLAREAMSGFLAKSAAPEAFARRTLAPKQRAVIDPRIDGTPVTRDMLVHVFHELRIDQPARITVFQRDPAADSLRVIDTLPRLPRVLPGVQASGAGRGLFSRSEVEVVGERAIDTNAGPQLLLVADGKVDPWIEGRDSIDPSSPIQNKGNYGVLYRFKLKYRGDKGLAVLMCGNRVDNKWCKYTAAVIEVNRGAHAGGIVALPADAPRFANLPEAVVMQTYAAPARGASGEIEFTYSPPGACCLPTPILLVPTE